MSRHHYPVTRHRRYADPRTEEAVIAFLLIIGAGLLIMLYGAAEALTAMSAPVCIATRAFSCGRPDLEDAIRHAQERAIALGRRQRVFVQVDVQTRDVAPGRLGRPVAYFRIEGAPHA